MWKRILDLLLALLKPKPAPVPVPEPPPPVPVPVPTPAPVPTPVPVPVPVPVPEPPAPEPSPACGKPTAVKLGIRSVAPIWNSELKRNHGFRIVFDVSPLVDGVKAPESCGDYYNATYGQVQAEQKGPGFDADPVERSSANPNFLQIATNNEADWEGGRYKLAGAYRVSAAYPWFKTWRSQDFSIDENGAPHGYGSNQQSYDRPK